MPSDNTHAGAAVGKTRNALESRVFHRTNARCATQNASPGSVLHPVPRHMNALATSSVVLACVFASALVGLYLRPILPKEHLQEDSKDLIKLGIGQIATLAALVLGLLISSAKTSFEKVNDDLVQTAAQIVLLDRVLVHYGPETKELRGRMKEMYAQVIQRLFSADQSERAKLEAPFALAQAEGIRTSLLQLAPQGDAQRWLKSRALEIFTDLSTERWLLLLQKQGSISPPFLVVLVFWLSMIFMAFGLLAPRNATVVCTLLICALSVSGAIFLLLEMEEPLDGLMKVSSEPLRAGLEHVGR